MQGSGYCVLAVPAASAALASQLPQGIFLRGRIAQLDMFSTKSGAASFHCAASHLVILNINLLTATWRENRDIHAAIMRKYCHLF